MKISGEKIAYCFSISFFLSSQSAQADPLYQMDGIWFPTNPPGPSITFAKVGASARQANFDFGHSVISKSNGEHGSNIRVSGDSFDCWYFYGKINEKKMVWDKKSGDPQCPATMVLEKDPP